MGVGVDGGVCNGSAASRSASVDLSESGIAPPSEVTLAAAADGADDVAILVKDADCDEVTIEATSSENPGEYRINASYVDIEVVESYPAVASLYVEMSLTGREESVY